MIDETLSGQRSTIQPSSGRVMIRQVAPEANFSDPILIIGILHLPSDFVPEENASYLLESDNGNLQIIPYRLDENKVDNNIHRYPEMAIDISSAMTSSDWPVPRPVNMMPIRFMKAFPDDNGWTCYGISSRNIFKNFDLDSNGHGWFDVDSGHMKKIDSPTTERGKTPSQILAQPVWPIADGSLYALATIESSWRPTYHQLSLIYASYGAGEITLGQMTDQVKANPRFQSIRHTWDDDEYFRYLAQLKKVGALKEHGPVSLEEYLGHKKIVKQAITESLNSRDGDRNSVSLTEISKKLKM